MGGKLSYEITVIYDIINYNSFIVYQEDKKVSGTGFDQRSENYFKIIKELAAIKTLREVNTSFSSVMRGPVALDYVLSEYNGAKTGNTVSKAYTEYLELVEDDKKLSDKIKLENRVYNLEKAVTVLLNHANLSLDEVDIEYEEMLQKEKENDNENLKIVEAKSEDSKTDESKPESDN